jgi:Zn-finger protein
MGVTKEENTTRIEFVGTDDVSGYSCKLDGGEFLLCRSPLYYSDLSSGAHRLIVNPTGCRGEKLDIKFEVE